MLEQIREDTRSLANAEKVKILSRFFKTGKGEYGEGDHFLGINSPQSTAIARKYASLGLDEVEELLKSDFHEERFIALLILVHKYQKRDETQKNDVFNFYLKNLRFVNNWDLVDLAAYKIVGAHLQADRSLLFKLARSPNVWERRIAIVATLHFIRKRDFTDTFKLAEILLNDKHDLIHKAVGWMLKEVGKRDQQAEEAFLIKHYREMPRTMLRYAIEKFSDDKRRFYMSRT